MYMLVASNPSPSWWTQPGLSKLRQPKRQGTQPFWAAALTAPDTVPPTSSFPGGYSLAAAAEFAFTAAIASAAVLYVFAPIPPVIVAPELKPPGGMEYGEIAFATRAYCENDGGAAPLVRIASEED